jgi:hypothetical protein
VIQYLTGVSNAAVRAIAPARGIGLLAQPGNGYLAQVTRFPCWAADTGCYRQGDRFDVAGYLGWLRSAPARGACRFATAPDVVGDAAATWARSRPVLPELRALSYPAALVAQNGLRVDGPGGELLVCGDDRDPGTWTGQTVPWSAFDVLFLGGDDRFKLSWRQHFLVHEAKRHGKAVHMGRVNSYARLQQAEWFGCDTADGTFLAFAGGAAGVTRLASWLDQVWPMPAPGAATSGRPGQAAFWE